MDKTSKFLAFTMTPAPSLKNSEAIVYSMLFEPPVQTTLFCVRFNLFYALKIDSAPNNLPYWVNMIKGIEKCF